MTIIAIDYGSQMGWAAGGRGLAPLSGVRQLSVGINEARGLYEAQRFLRELAAHCAAEHGPVTDLLFEQRLVGHVRTGRNAQLHLIGICAVIQAQAHAWGTRIHEVPVQKVRAWLLPDVPAKERTKDAVRQRLYERGVLSKLGVPLDQSDAVALYCWQALPALPQLSSADVTLPLLGRGE